MSSAAARFQRLMLLLPRCATGQTLSLAELSRELDISPDSILQDIMAVVDRDDDRPGQLDPISLLIDGDTITLRCDHFRRPMRLTAAELCALEVGLAVLQRQRGEEAGDAYGALRQKLARCITRLPQDRVHDGIRDGVFTLPRDRTVLARLHVALRRSCAVVLSYQSARAATATSRRVDPYRLIFHQGRWYLAGWCGHAEALRLFRVDRIHEVTLTDDTITIPPDIQLDDIVQDGRPFVRDGSTAELVVRYGPAIARWIVERDGGPLESDGSAIRRMPLADREWAIRHVLQYGPDARVVEPGDLADEIDARLATMAEMQ